MTPAPDADRLREHLTTRHQVPVLSVEPFQPPDGSTFDVRLADGRRWVARVGRDATRATIEARLLDRLEQAGFPAERCACPEPVSDWDGRAVLVTGFVEGTRAEPSGRTWATLGALLGRLNARAGTGLPPAGAWHHLATGSPRAELDAATALLDQTLRATSGPEAAAVAALLDEVEEIDDAADLPHAVVHPDCVPVNAIVDPDGRHVLVDWTGAGNGPRIWSLALPLWAATARSPKLTDVFLSRYLRHSPLTGPEVERLAGIVAARPLLLDVWLVTHGRRSATSAVAALGRHRSLGETAAARVSAAD